LTGCGGTWFAPPDRLWFPKQGEVPVDFGRMWDVYPAEYPAVPLKPATEAL